MTPPSITDLINIKKILFNNIFDITGDKLIFETYGNGFKHINTRKFNFNTIRECIDSDNQFWYQNTDSCYDLGDLNEDGATNVADIVGLVNAILNSQDYMIEYDVNQDGIINVADIVSLVNLILNN